MSVGVVDGKVSVDPDFDFSGFVDTDLVFLDEEELGMLIDSAVPFEGLHHDIQILWVGDIEDLAAPDADVLDVDAGHIALGTEFVFVLEVDVLGPDHVGLLVPPIVRFKVIVELLLVLPDEVVFIDLLPSRDVLEGAEIPVILVRVFPFREVLPLAGVEGRTFNLNRRPASHNQLTLRIL